MTYWLCFTPHVNCSGQCAVCLNRDRPVEIHAVEAHARPLCALNGPCATPQELLGRLAEYFEFDSGGRLRLKEQS